MISLDPLDVSAPVSVVMTVRNEESHLEKAIQSVLTNGYEPGVELVVAVGPSVDRTAQIARRLGEDPRVTVIDNPSGGTAQGLNLALAAATHDVVVRMDGHGEMPSGYIAQAVHTLAATGAANVGGRMVPDADEPFARAVAVAMKSRWGLGGAGHRVGGNEGEVDSVFLGSFRAAAVRAVGGYDEHFVRAQDWELNFRLREAGFIVWFEPRMEVAYRPRSSARTLARQFFSSGQWRREVARTHRLEGGVRYLAPPTVLAAIAVATVVGVVGILSPWWWLSVAFVVPAAYVAGVLGVSMLLAPRAGLRACRHLPGVLITMHMAWGAGFLRGVR